jgi:hypothetical protein
MSKEAQSWREVGRMVQGLMQEAEGRAGTGSVPLEARPHREADTRQERPPPELGHAWRLQPPR